MADFPPNASAVHLPVVQPERDEIPYSHAHLARFTQCPLSYRLHYVDRLPDTVGGPGTFGRVIHRALETAVREHVRAGQVGPVDTELAAAAYRQAWTDSPLGDHALFGEGLAMVRRWVAREGAVDPANVLGVDQEFELAIGPVRLRGAMDRVDRIGDDAVRIRDYTSTRLPPRREDAEESLKLALFDLAARAIWPWARRVELGLDLLRHDFVLTVERSDAQREATRRFVLATVAQIARGEWEARPSTLCTSCDHRWQCPSWEDARAGKRLHAGADKGDLPAVAREREELALVLKALDERKGTLDAILRAELDHRDALVLQGHRYEIVTAVRRDYPLEPTLTALGVAGVPREHALPKLGAVDGGALKTLLANLRATLAPEDLGALRRRLEEHVRLSPVPRLVSRPVRS